MTDFVAIEQALLDLQADITAQQATVQALIDAVNSDKGAALGIATLGSNSRLQPAQHPPLNSGQIYVGSAGNIPVTESLLSAIASRSTNSANQPLILDGSGLVSTSNIPSSIVTGASFRGAWNASTNSPTLTSSVGTNGHWYYVGTAGSTTLNGITSWQKGDIVIFNNGTTAWEKIDGSDAVISVQADGGTAKQGTVSLSLNEFTLTNGNIIRGNVSNLAQSVALNSVAVDLVSNQTIAGTKIFSDLITLNSGTGLLAISIANNTAVTVGFQVSKRGFLIVHGNADITKQYTGSVAFRTTNPNAGDNFIQAAWGFSAATVNYYNNTILTGTTGALGSLNFGANNGIIYIENRLGGGPLILLYTFIQFLG